MPSSWRPPWLDTTIASTPAATSFFMLVTMAVITTFMTAPLLRLGLKKAPKTSLAHIPEPVQRQPEQARTVVPALSGPGG